MANDYKHIKRLLNSRGLTDPEVVLIVSGIVDKYYESKKTKKNKINAGYFLVFETANRTGVGIGYIYNEESRQHLEVTCDESGMSIITEKVPFTSMIQLYGH